MFILLKRWRNFKTQKLNQTNNIIYGGNYYEI